MAGLHGVRNKLFAFTGEAGAKQVEPIRLEEDAILVGPADVRGLPAMPACVGAAMQKAAFDLMI
jgi:hypothetical protein